MKGSRRPPLPALITVPNGHSARTNALVRKSMRMTAMASSHQRIALVTRSISIEKFVQPRPRPVARTSPASNLHSWDISFSCSFCYLPPSSAFGQTVADVENSKARARVLAIDCECQGGGIGDSRSDTNRRMGYAIHAQVTTCDA